MKNIIIAIDGFSSTGKSTIAKRVANELGYIYVDSGALYRGATLLAIEKNLIHKNENSSEENNFSIDAFFLLKSLKEEKLHFIFNKNVGFSELYLNDRNIETNIRTLEVAERVSFIAKIPEIRTYITNLQRIIGSEKKAVIDGRDIGTIVFPDAELKIFMTASDDVRAERRYKELLEKGEKTTLPQVLKNLKERDFLDSTREDSPLKKAEDAIEIDNTFTTIEEVVQRIISLAQSKINS